MTSNEDRLSAIKACLGVILIFCMAAILSYDEYPAYYYDDETIAVNVIRFMEEHSSLDTNWNNADWGGTWTPYMFDYDQYNFSSWISSQYYLKQVASLFYKTEPLLLYRYFTLAFHLLTLTLVLYAGWRWMGVHGSLLSGGFFAVTPMFMIDTHYVRPETFLTLAVSLAVFVHIELERNATKKSSLDMLAGFIWGIGITCKISIIPMAVVFFLRRVWVTRHVHTVYSWVSGSLLAALVFAPYLFINYDYILSGAKALFGQYMAPGSENIRPTILSKYLVFFVGPIALAAIIFSSQSKIEYLRVTSKILLLSSLFYLVFFSLASFINESNMSHMGGAWSWMFAVGMGTFLSKTSNLQHYKKLALVIIIAALIPPTVISIMIYKYVFSNAGEIQASIRSHEKSLMQKYGVSLIVPAESTNVDILQNIQLPDNILIRVALTECYSYKKTIEWLDNQPSIQQAGELILPLNFLPCSNKIDTIHFPPGYAYYISVNAENASGRMN